MYCPRCAAPQADNTKFCRACGADLQSVALALAEQQLPAKPGQEGAKQPKAEQSWLEKRSEGVRDTVQGVILLGAALLIGLAFPIG
jgi:hypothetical protein